MTIHRTETEEAWELVEGTFAAPTVAAVDKPDSESQPVSSSNSSVSLNSTRSSEIDMAQLQAWTQQFDSAGRLAQNVATATAVRNVTASRSVLQTSDSPYFKINLDHGGMPATDQADSGRCWMFGTLNLFRFGTRGKLGLDDFEFSESYLLFYYLLEQANFMLELFWNDLKDKPLEDRVVQNFLEWPIDDGGDWGIAVNLIQKYGLVPKDVYSESYSSQDTGEMDQFLVQLVVSAIFRMRQAQGGIDTEEAFAKLKSQCLADCHRVLTIHLGTPPTPTSKFTWSWRDDTEDEAFHTLCDITPIEFCQKFVTVPYQDYVSLINDDRHDYYYRYQVEYAMPMCGGKPIQFVNIPIDEMKSMALAMLRDKLPVFFACVVELELDDDVGLWDADMYETQQFYRVSVATMSKADRVRFGVTSMGDHVMLITGVHLDEEDRPIRWRVENSWGEASGMDGYFAMNDNWFALNVFEIVAPPSYLSNAATQSFLKDVRTLPPWDPMSATGSRGRRRSRRLGSRVQR